MTWAKPILILLASCAMAAAQGIQPADLWKQSVPAADHKLAYGQDALQFGGLRLPKTKGPHPVVILCTADATWTAFPGVTRATPPSNRCARFQPRPESLPGISSTGVPEIAAAGGLAPFSIWLRALTFCETIARDNHLADHRVVVVGHSSGGSFAHWLAARSKLPRSSPLYSKNPLHVKAVVNIDGPPELGTFQPIERKGCPVPGLTQLMGGTPPNSPNATARVRPPPPAGRRSADNCRRRISASHVRSGQQL